MLVGALLAVVVTAVGPAANPSAANAATTLSPTPDAIEGTCIRVRSRDNLDHVSAWSAEMSVPVR